MKAIYLVAIVTFFAGCSGASNTKNTVDTMNGVDNKMIQDTQVGPQQNGYAPPNTKIDTSQRLRDSIKASHK